MARTRERVASMPKAVIQSGQPVIGVFVDPDDEDLTYFASEEEAEAAITEEAIQDALDQVGAWSDLDWEEVETLLQEIDRGGSPSE